MNLRPKRALLTFLVIWSTWGFHERVLSSTTPRHFTVFSNLTTLPFGRVTPCWLRRSKTTIACLQGDYLTVLEYMPIHHPQIQFEKYHHHPSAAADHLYTNKRAEGRGPTPTEHLCFSRSWSGWLREYTLRAATQIWEYPLQDDRRKKPRRCSLSSRRLGRLGG